MTAKEFPRTILVVDDESTITSSLVMVLNRFRYEFSAFGATSFDQARAMVSNIRPELVLLDVHMPGVEGLEGAIELQNKFGLKVVLISGSPDTAELLDKAKQQHGMSFPILAKPIPPIELVDSIRKLVASDSFVSRSTSI